MAPKSLTAPIAMGVAREIGGVPELTAVVVIAAGSTSAILVTPLLNTLGLRDWRAGGCAVGLAAHGIGTARALQVHPVANTFAALAMALNGSGPPFSRRSSRRCCPDQDVAAAQHALIRYVGPS